MPPGSTPVCDRCRNSTHERVSTLVADLSPSSVESVSNLSLSQICRISRTTDNPPYIGVVLSDAAAEVVPEDPRHAALAEWRHRQRHAMRNADMSLWARAWTWLETPDAEQRAICTASHFHDGECPTPRGNHYCHRNGCKARHGHRATQEKA